MSEASEIAIAMANAAPLAVAALRTESDRLAYLDAQGMTAEEVGSTVRANVADELELEAARLRSQAAQSRGAPMGSPASGQPAPGLVAVESRDDKRAPWRHVSTHGDRASAATALDKYACAGIRRDNLRIEPVPDLYRLFRVPLNSGGYDAGGSYFGLGAPLYAFESSCGTHRGHVRARSRDLAKAEVRKLAPNATFHR